MIDIHTNKIKDLCIFSDPGPDGELGSVGELGDTVASINRYLHHILHLIHYSTLLTVPSESSGVVSGLTSSLASVTRESPQLEEDRDMEDSLQTRANTRLKSAMVGEDTLHKLFYDTIARTILENLCK